MQKITMRAREMRKNMTSAEEIIWGRVRNNKLGVKVVRQKPLIIEYYGRKVSFVADFYCHEAKLAIEIDGKVHDEKMEYDIVRTQLLQQTGIEIIRFSNEEVLRKMDMVIDAIKRKLSERLNR